MWPFMYAFSTVSFVPASQSSMVATQNCSNTILPPRVSSRSTSTGNRQALRLTPKPLRGSSRGFHLEATDSKRLGKLDLVVASKSDPRPLGPSIHVLRVAWFSILMHQALFMSPYSTPPFPLHFTSLTHCWRLEREKE